MTLYFVGGLIGALSGGALSDYIGRKPVLMLGGCLVGIGGLIHAAAVHIGFVQFFFSICMYIFFSELFMQYRHSKKSRYAAINSNRHYGSEVHLLRICYTVKWE